MHKKSAAVPLLGGGFYEIHFFSNARGVLLAGRSSLNSLMIN
jgi:hypothetical protein